MIRLLVDNNNYYPILPFAEKKEVYKHDAQLHSITRAPVKDSLMQKIQTQENGFWESDHNQSCSADLLFQANSTATITYCAN